jgi:hypothetical protein
MRSDELANWLSTTHNGCAEDIVRDAGLDPDQAAAKAAADTEQVFPGGRPSGGQLVFVVEAEVSRSRAADRRPLRTGG